MLLPELLRPDGPSGIDVIQPAQDIFGHRVVTAFALKLVVVVQLPCIDQGDIAFAIAGDDLLATRPRLLGKGSSVARTLFSGTMSAEVMDTADSTGCTNTLMDT